MITFVTDVWPGESDIIAGHEGWDLVLASFDTSAEIARIFAPGGGWSHDRLLRFSGLINTGDAYLVPPGTPFDQATAYWIGGSEV